MNTPYFTRAKNQTQVIMKAYKIILLLLLFFSITSCIVHEEKVEGTADTVYSSTITILESDFVNEDEYVTVAEYGWDNLDEEMVDYGLVLGYIKFKGTTAWHALPYAVPYENDLVNLRYFFDINNFSLVLEGEVPYQTRDNAAIFHGDVLRIIAIPPTQIIRAKGFNYRNYNQVIEYYNIDK